MKCNECNPCNECNSCGKCGGCKPAEYGCDFDIQADPFDPTTWLVTTGGMMHKVKIPGNGETDTTLSTNYSNKGLNYKAEKHTDTISGKQLGDIIDLEDLRDVQVDDLKGNCYEFIYSKYGDCGEGCQSPADKWHNFNINSDGAKQDWIQYVRGANAYGCPVYLDMPTNKDQYWFGGWRRNGEHYEFGYFQPGTGSIPTDTDGNPLVMSMNQTTKQPIVGPLKINIDMLMDDAICSSIDPASGFTKSESEGNGMICYYPKLKMAKIDVDFLCTVARPEQVYFNLVIGTIRDSRLWPKSNYYDLPTHWVWKNNSNGAIMPISLRFDTQGQLLLSGEMTARTTSGKAAFIALGVDDTINWDIR